MGKGDFLCGPVETLHQLVVVMPSGNAGNLNTSCYTWRIFHLRLGSCLKSLQCMAHATIVTQACQFPKYRVCWTTRTDQPVQTRSVGNSHPDPGPHVEHSTLGAVHLFRGQTPLFSTQSYNNRRGCLDSGVLWFNKGLSQLSSVVLCSLLNTLIWPLISVPGSTFRPFTVMHIAVLRRFCWTATFELNAQLFLLKQDQPGRSFTSIGINVKNLKPQSSQGQLQHLWVSVWVQQLCAVTFSQNVRISTRVPGDAEWSSNHVCPDEEHFGFTDGSASLFCENRENQALILHVVPFTASRVPCRC